MSEDVLVLENVTKKYGEFTAVDDVSLCVPRGSIYGFLGPNGAGKTTTIRMVLEILEPTSGKISVFGDHTALEVRDRIGYLPEEKGLYKKMKAWSIIAYFASLKGMGRREAKAKAHELLERYGLGKFADSKTEALSKGMGQKVQVLAAIAHDPELVILDEPFSGLDPVNQEVMEEVIRDMAARGHTVIFSTHVMQHAERICNRLLLIAKGQKIFDGTIPEAKATLPMRARIETDDDITPLRQLSEVTAVRSLDVDGKTQENGTGPLWELTLRDKSDPQILLRTCFDHDIRLRQLDHSDPSLHDVFVHLVGEGAREAAYR